MSTENYSDKKKRELIDKLKLAVDQCLEIIGKDIDEDVNTDNTELSDVKSLFKSGKITDDKLHNVLKGKKMATEDVRYYLDQIKELEEDLNGVSTENKKRKVANFAEQMADK